MSGSRRLGAARSEESSPHKFVMSTPAWLEATVADLTAEASYDSDQYTRALESGDGRAASMWLTALTLATEALRRAHNALVAESGGEDGLYAVQTAAATSSVRKRLGLY